MNDWEKSLRERYQSPSLDGIEAYYFSLDGGGRDMLIDLMKARNTKLMLEIGCFLCGSTVQWLSANKDLKVIGVDPWEADFSQILERFSENPVFASCFKPIADTRAFIDSVKRHGPMASALANVREFGDRFLPLKAYSPNILYEISELQIEPDLIYFDSNKLLNELEICRDLFPDAILSGDDWTWGADQGFPVQRAVADFCKQNGYAVQFKRATWFLQRESVV